MRVWDKLHGTTEISLLQILVPSLLCCWTQQKSPTPPKKRTVSCRELALYVSLQQFLICCASAGRHQFVSQSSGVSSPSRVLCLAVHRLREGCMAREGDNHWALLTQEEFSPPWKFRSFRFPCIHSFPLWFLDHVIFTLIHFSPVVTVEKIVGHNLVKAANGSETPTEPCEHLMLFF